MKQYRQLTASIYPVFWKERERKKRERDGKRRNEREI